MKCFCPANSSKVLGRIRTARGAAAAIFAFSAPLNNVSLLELLAIDRDYTQNPFTLRMFPPLGFSLIKTHKNIFLFDLLFNTNKLMKINLIGGILFYK